MPRYRIASAFVLGLGLVMTGASSVGRVGVAVSAQQLNPCALLTAAEIEPLAVNVAAGVSTSLPGYAACRYVWGAGLNRFTLEVTVNDASVMFAGMSPEQITQHLLKSVRAGTDDAVVTEIGDAAVFTPDSPVYASATAFVKGRILAVHLDGIDAREKKDQVIALLKSAVSRL